ncbi:MAG: hypothetical protein L6Q49_11400, partial [Anaerolineales bacterium]|nr:hypothetical protein [Anaerolineales bacterium]
ILITGWALGRLIEITDWESLKQKKFLSGLAAVAVFIISGANVIYAWNSPMRPFQGTSLEQLQATNLFLLPLLVLILSAAAA